MKMKRMTVCRMAGLAVIAALVIFLCGTAASADTAGTCGENLSWTLDEAGILTISGTGDMADNPVWPVSEIRRAVIEDGVTSIGSYAFYGCGNLEYVRIPATVTFIGDRAFFNCSRLTDIMVFGADTEIGSDIVSVPTLRVCCLQGSDADRWARVRGYEVRYELPSESSGMSEPEYTWSADNRYVTASRHSLSDPSYVETETVSAVPIISTGASCEQMGITAYTGRDFANPAFTAQTKYIQDIPALGHLLAEHAAEPATCTQQGTEAYWECTVCRKLFSDRYGRNMIYTPVRTAVKGHNLQKHDKVAASCAAAGTEAYWSCPECGKLFSDRWGRNQISAPVQIPAKSHRLTKHAQQDPTCTKAGTAEYWECYVCGRLFSDAEGKNQIYNLTKIPAQGHLTIAYKGMEATCNGDGVQPFWKCMLCGKLFSDAACTNEIPEPVTIHAAGHALKKHDKVEATCTKEGTETYWECVRCEELFADVLCTKPIEAPVAIPAKGHDLEKHDRKGGGCTKEGWEEYWQCRECEQYFSDAAGKKKISAPVVIPPHGHDWDKTIYTWSSDNSKVTAKRTCKISEAHVETETVNATLQISKDATTKEEGSGEYVSDKFKNKAFKVQKKEIVIPVFPASVSKSSGDYQIKNNLTVVYKGPNESTDSSVTIPNTITVNGRKLNVTSIADNAFKGNTKVKSVEIGANVKTIGNNAFNGCEKLRKVSGMEGVTSIGDGAFMKCTSLKAITLPAKVSEIGLDAFRNCEAMNRITIQTTKLTADSVGDSAFKGIDKDAVIACPKAKLKDYKSFLTKRGVPKTAVFQ